jgi:DNA polymerase IV
MGAQHALGRRGRSRAEVDAVLVGLVDRLGGRLRAAGRVCRTVTLRLRFSDWSRATRSSTLREPTAATGAVLAAAQELLAAAMPMIEARGITLVGVALSNLEDEGGLQLPLQGESERALDASIDRVRERFGTEAITRAALVGRERGAPPPRLPD